MKLPIVLVNVFTVVTQFFLIPVVLIFAIFVRGIRGNDLSVGFGPEPLSPQHAAALRFVGVEAKSFVSLVYYTNSNFDYVLSRKSKLGRAIDRATFRTTFHALNNYNVLFFYFNGGPFGFGTHIYWRLESYIYRIAGIKVILMAYGGDVQDLRQNPNLLYKNALIQDYPMHWRNQNKIAKKIRYWQSKADFVLSGCDWVYYLTYWDKLVLSHFVVDLDSIQVNENETSNENLPLKILHAPNHRAIKGSKQLEIAVGDLKSEGFNIELVTLEKVSNATVLDAIQECDVVVEQLVIGWYALFAIEAMAAGKPVITHIDEELLRLYTSEGLLSENELPVIQADTQSIKAVLKDLAINRGKLNSYSSSSRQFVEKHHSYESIGTLFLEIIEAIRKVK